MKRIAFILLTLGMTFNLFAYSNCFKKKFEYHNSINQADRLFVKDFLNMLVVQQCGINIIYEDPEAKNIVQNAKMPFLNVKNYTLDQLLNLIFSDLNVFYSFDKKNDLLKLSFIKTKTYNLDFLISTRLGISNLSATDTKVVNNYNFGFWDKMKQNVTLILKNTAANSEDYKEPVIDKEAGLITVTGTKRQLDAVDRYVRKIVHRLTKQVLIDVKIYSVELSKSHQTGIDWSKFAWYMPNTVVPLGNAGNKFFGSGNIIESSKFNLQGFINFLAQNGNVYSISNPKIATLNNQKAVISIGDTIYYKYASNVVSDQAGNPNTQYTIDSKFVGVILDITPQINDKGEVILNIVPRISTFKDELQLKNTNRDMPPDTRDESMITTVKLKNNTTLVLGGLIAKNDNLRVNGVPILKEIPILKYLFSSKEKISNKKELVFVITPHIINFSDKKHLKDLDF